MTVKEQLTREFEHRVFEESYARIYRCLSLLNDQQIWLSPQGNVPSIGCLILHLSGNARQWILSGIGGEPDNRNRDDEFVIHHNIRKADFVFLLENLKSKLQDCLHDMPEEMLTKTLHIQGFEVTGFSVLVHVIEHFSYHTGQITTLTKIYGQQDTGYYAGLNLNIRNQMN
jgi:uncharacterized damage-inducible protein DinB